MKKATILSLLSVLFVYVITSGQDTYFTQYFSNSLFLNPAYTGSLGCSRLGLNWRIMAEKYQSHSTYCVSYDQKIGKIPGSIGIQFYDDHYKVFGLTSESFINANVVYAIDLLNKEKLHLRPAIKIGYGDHQYKSKSSYTEEEYTTMSKAYYNAGAGLLIVFYKFTSGISFDHLNKPDIAFKGSSILPDVNL